jgi:hypothetical protein
MINDKALCAFFLEKLEVIVILEALDFLEAIDTIVAL